MRPQAPADPGFTLIDTLIAMVIMSTTVIALVTAMTGLITTTQFHRGNAVAESVTHSFIEAVTAKINGTTRLTAAATSADGSLQVQDVTPFSAPGYLNIDDDMMAVTGINVVTNRLTVQRSIGDPASNAPHAVGAAVVPAFRCPSAAELTPPLGSWAPSGVTAVISSIEFWEPTSGSFVDLPTCKANYVQRCLKADGSQGDVRVGCGSGLQRITIDVSTSGDARYKGATAVTQALVRRGSP